MADDDPLRKAVPDSLHVTPRVREREVLKKGDNFTSTGMNRASKDAENEDLDSEWKRRLKPIREKLEAQSYAKGGQVGKVNPFGMKNSKPDFASGGPQGNRKFNFKKGDM